MSGRRLPLIVILVAGSVAIVALVANGRPLAADAGRGGVSGSFWSYVLTTVIILFVLGILLIVASLFEVRMTFTKPKGSYITFFFRSVLGLILVGGLMTFFVRRLIHHGGFDIHTGGGGVGPPNAKNGTAGT